MPTGRRSDAKPAPDAIRSGHCRPSGLWATLHNGHYGRADKGGAGKPQLDTAQGYFPEWLQTGFEDTDADQLGRLYNQAQWRHSFGVSSLPTPLPPPENPYLKFFRAADPTGTVPLDAEAVFGQLQIAFAALERAGPDLNPGSFANAMFSLYLPVNPLFYCSRNDYGGIKDAREVWWDPDAIGADGVRGTYEQVDGGHRYALGAWPDTPTEVFDPSCLPAGSCGAPK